MVLFQPSGPPPTVWEFAWYEWGQAIEIVLWIAAITSIFFAFFLLASYLNNRKPEHLYWGISFALIWINTHLAIFYQVISSGSVERGKGFATWTDPVNATYFALAIGLFAVGLWKNVKPESKLGNYLLYYVIVMSLAIGIFKTETVAIVLGYGTYLVPILVMALHVPSAIIIIWLPLTTRDENGKSAIMMSIGGILMSLVGVLLAIATLGILATEMYLYIVIAALPFVYLLSVMSFAWGTFIPKRWGFGIAGIELED